MTFVRDDLRPVQRRVVVLVACFASLFALLIGRVWMLQVVEGWRWREMAESNRLRRLPLEAPRGIVTDMNGEVILDNRPVFELLIFPEEIEDPQRTESFLHSIGVASRAELSARMAKARSTSHLPSVIADNLTWPQVTTIAAHRAELRGLEIHPASRRFPPAGPVVAHLVGQLAEVTPGQLAKNRKLRLGQLVGRTGIEHAYEDELGGGVGHLVVVVDALGRQVSNLNEEPPRPGKPLQTSIDLGLQREAAAAMAGQVGAVVALDPRNGEVRVLLSMPSFDPELFAGHLEAARWSELTADPLKPLHNRATQALYPPGSTIKPLYAAGALMAGLRAPADTVTCTGAVTIHGHPYRCWQRGGHGRVGLLTAIEASCDTYFYRLAQEAGIERLAEWVRTMGLGSLTGFELGAESDGLVPSDAWSRRARGHQWYAGETISVGIGQGPILATPLQLARAYAVLVNGGFLVRPHLVKGQGGPAEPTGIPEEVLAIVRQGMERVVAGPRGTARRLAALPVAIAGKTGTSQVVRKQEGVRWQDLPWEQRHHALFVGYAPADAPELVVVVVVEHGGDAASVAAPIAGRILQLANAGPTSDPPPIVTAAAPPPATEEPPRAAP